MNKKAFEHSSVVSRNTLKSRNMYYSVTQVRLSLLACFPQIYFLLKCSGGVINHGVYEASHCKDIKRKAYLTLIRRKVTKNENSYDLSGLIYCKLSRYLWLKFWNRGPIYFISVTWLDEGKKNDQKLGCNKDGQ